MVLPHRPRHGSPGDGEHHIRGSGDALDLDLRVSELTDGHGRVLGRAVVVRDITELHEQRQRLAEVNVRLREQLQVIEALRNDLAELAIRDDLTGLHNRRYLLGQLEAQLDTARSVARPMSLMLLDIDHFKSVNDRNGHAVGDELLVATAKALTECVRAGDTVARYGGEEFVVLLPGTSSDEARHMAEVLRTRCGTVRVDGRLGPVSTTVSAGVSTFPVCGWSGAELLQSADEALYAAKRAGRDRVVCAPVPLNAAGS
jgi:diguanylate cyclase (GGDEF)-like protein